MYNEIGFTIFYDLGVSSIKNNVVDVDYGCSEIKSSWKSSYHQRTLEKVLI